MIVSQILSTRTTVLPLGDRNATHQYAAGIEALRGLLSRSYRLHDGNKCPSVNQGWCVAEWSRFSGTHLEKIPERLRFPALLALILRRQLTIPSCNRRMR